MVQSLATLTLCKVTSETIYINGEIEARVWLALLTASLTTTIIYNGCMLLAALLAVCLLTPSPQPAAGPSRVVATAATYLTGDFTSSAQAEADDRYFAIELHVRPIWQGRDDGPWLYVEQAAARAVERPYRQRIYRVAATEDGRVVSYVYTLPGDPLAYAGAYRAVEKFDELSPDDLTLRDGCGVYLTQEGQSFVGGTEGKGCASTLGGASYATSEVTLNRDQLQSWDRGFSADGEQVWGAEAGPYLFERMVEQP